MTYKCEEGCGIREVPGCTACTWTGEGPSARLRARADVYSSDASTLRSIGENDAALIYETVRDELRKCAEEAADTEGLADAWAEGYAAAGLEKIARHERARNPYA